MLSEALQKGKVAYLPYKEREKERMRTSGSDAAAAPYLAGASGNSGVGLWHGVGARKSQQQAADAQRTQKSHR